MPRNIVPVLHPVSVAELRPTQMTVGLREVALKRKELRALAAGKKDDFLGLHLIPAVIGPKQRPFVVDHHHLARALHEEGIGKVLISVLADLSRLTKEEFLVFLDNRAWMHPFDASGRRRAYEYLPKSIDRLVDDPFRSLAGAVRRAGGYAKDTTPFAEFLWADFFRRRIDPGLLADNFDRVARKAVALARDKSASHLPGWSGPDD